MQTEDVVQVFFRRRAANADDALKLVKGVASGEERLSSEEFSENAPDGPADEEANATTKPCFGQDNSLGKTKRLPLRSHQRSTGFE